MCGTLSKSDVCVYLCSDARFLFRLSMFKRFWIVGSCVSSSVDHSSEVSVSVQSSDVLPSLFMCMCVCVYVCVHANDGLCFRQLIIRTLIDNSRKMMKYNIKTKSVVDVSVPNRNSRLRMSDSSEASSVPSTQADEPHSVPSPPSILFSHERVW